jgi:hypothetical protein
MVPGVSSVVFLSLGGGAVTPTPPGLCDADAFAYIMAPASGELWWDVCTAREGAGGAVEWVPVTGMRTLSSAERASLNIALAGVRVSGRTACGQDKAQWELVVEAPSFLVVYGDDFYACVDDYPHFVTEDSLQKLLLAVSPLAR